MVDLVVLPPVGPMMPVGKISLFISRALGESVKFVPCRLGTLQAKYV